jgi:hypothetical protein
MRLCIPFFAAALCIFGARAWAVEEPDAPQLKKEQALLEKLERIEAEHGALNALAIAPLLDLGGLYISQDRCPDAITVLTQALRLSRAIDGLFNAQQMELLEPLIECYLSLDRMADFEREQRYALLVSDTNFGTSDPRALALLHRIGVWYEEAGWYISAREIHLRALEIARRSGDPADARMIEPLQSIARSFRREYTYGLDSIDSEGKKDSRMRSRAYLQNGQLIFDRLGEDSLKQAAALLRRQPVVDRVELVNTLLDLGDWYQMGRLSRDALHAYHEAWLESRMSDYVGDALFSIPVAVLYRPEDTGSVMRRPPPNRENFQHYWVDFDFKVTRDGDVKDVRITGSNAPEPQQWRLKKSLSQMRFRPRFVDGEAVDTVHAKSRQGVWVEKKRWKFEFN